MGEVTLVIARHGNTFESGEEARYVGAKTDLPLTAAGKRQAENVAKFLKSSAHIPQRLIAGPLKRQSQTAEIVKNELALPINVETTSALAEIDYGPWENLTAQEIQAKWPLEFSQWTKEFKWPIGVFPSTENEMRERLIVWLKDLSIRSEEIVFAVSSNGTLRYLHEVCAGRSKLPHGDIKVRTGSICIIRLAKEKYEIVAWNQTP